MFYSVALMRGLAVLAALCCCAAQAAPSQALRTQAASDAASPVQIDIVSPDFSSVETEVRFQDDAVEAIPSTPLGSACFVPDDASDSFRMCSKADVDLLMTNVGVRSLACFCLHCRDDALRRCVCSFEVDCPCCHLRIVQVVHAAPPCILVMCYLLYTLFTWAVQAVQEVQGADARTVIIGGGAPPNIPDTYSVLTFSGSRNGQEIATSGGASAQELYLLDPRHTGHRFSISASAKSRTALVVQDMALWAPFQRFKRLWPVLLDDYFTLDATAAVCFVNTCVLQL